MLRVGIIGCGYMGTMHANCYIALGDKVEVSAVADIREDKAKEISALTGAKIFADAEALINGAEVDFVDICLPTYLHEKYAVMAMEKGFDVFVEKPLCLTNEEAERMLAVQKKTGRIVQVGQVIRFWDEFVWLKSVADSKVYGKIINGSFKRVSSRPTWAWNNWLHTPEMSGGMALDMHIHDIDFIRYLMGEPKEIRTAAVKECEGLEDYIMSSYIYDDAVLTAQGSWNYPVDFPFTAAYCVKFEKATACYDSGAGKIVVYFEDGGKFEPEIKKSFDGSAGSGNISSLAGYYNELEYFVKLLENPTLPNIASLSEGARSVELALLGKKIAY